jgi:FixJ family two-component response regulator
VIFADSTLPDGTWADIVSLADKCPRPLNVVVVSRELDLDLYMKVLESGAFGFIVPPFMDADLLHIVNCTVWKGLAQERPPTSERAAA